MGKGIKLANNIDLSPIKNLWSVDQQKLDQMPQTTKRDGLIQKVKCTWLDISPHILESRYSSMPDRMLECVKRMGGNIGK